MRQGVIPPHPPLAKGGLQMTYTGAMRKDRILIVDDESDMREFLEIMLGKEGYDTPPK